MTVSQLIEKLQTLPQDLHVVYWACSSPTAMSVDEIRVSKPKEIQLHNGGYVEYRDFWQPKGGPPPEFVQVVVFPATSTPAPRAKP